MNWILALKFFVSVLPFIQQAILTVEKLHGPGTGPTKLDTVVKVVSALLPQQEVETAKTVTELLPAVISHAVQEMNTAGDLPKPGAPQVG